MRTCTRRRAEPRSRSPLLKAEEDLAKAELELSLRPRTPQKPAAEKKRDAAKTAVAAATKALENPGETYTIPRGALKTQENNLEAEPSRRKPFPTTSTGRRTALAKWITDRQNPLTARVAVNHIWARHFGKPLVATVFDFGRKGAPPTHPELLDWLAVELMEHDWSMKHLHRLIVTSAHVSPDRHRNCGHERTQGRSRESLLLADESGADGGADRPRQPAAPGRGTRSDARRAVDRRQCRTIASAAACTSSTRTTTTTSFLTLFDDASVLECYRRTESIVPQQALALANSKLALTMAEAIAARLAKPQAADAEYRAGGVRDCCWARHPTAEERPTCLEALTEWQKILKEQKHADPAAKARANLVRALLNHNDFVTVR